MKKINDLASMIRTFATYLLAAAILLVTASGKAVAFDLKPSEIRGKSSKEPVTVLQSRYFLKAWRPEVGFMVGSLLDEAYLNTRTMGMRTGLFFNEWLGFEVQMQKTSVSDSDDRKALNKIKYHVVPDSSSNAVPEGADTDVTVSPDPEVNAVKGMTDIDLIAAPFYGKLNLVDKWIIYTDLYVTAGASRVETQQGDKTAMVFGAGERFYVGKSLSLRIDFRDRIFNETRAEKKTRKNSYGFDVGASYFFN